MKSEMDGNFRDARSQYRRSIDRDIISIKEKPVCY